MNNSFDPSDDDSRASFYESHVTINSEGTHKTKKSEKNADKNCVVPSLSDEARQNSSTSPSVVQLSPLKLQTAVSLLTEPHKSKNSWNLQRNINELSSDANLEKQQASVAQNSTDSLNAGTVNFNLNNNSDVCSVLTEEEADFMKKSPLKDLEIPSNIRNREFDLRNKDLFQTPSFKNLRELNVMKEYLSQKPLHRSTPMQIPDITKPNCLLAMQNPKKMSGKTLLISNNFQEAQVNVLYEELKKTIENVKNSQRWLYTTQKEYFDKQRAELDVAWAEYDEDRIKSYEEIEVLKKALDDEEKNYKTQLKDINSRWEELERSRMVFIEEKNAENAKIAQIRNELKQQGLRRSNKDNKEQISEFENRLKKQSEQLDNRNRTISELRKRLTKAEDSNKLTQSKIQNHEKLFNDVKQLRKKISEIQLDNTALRKKLALTKKENEYLRDLDASANVLGTGTSLNTTSGRTNASLLRKNNISLTTQSAFSNLHRSTSSVTDLSNLGTTSGKRVHWSSQIARSKSASDLSINKLHFTLPGSSTKNAFGDMVNTKYEFTKQGNEYFFTNGPTSSLVCTELKCRCKLIKRPNGDFTWNFRPAAESVELNYYALSSTFEIWTPKKNRILLFADKHFTIYYANGNRTLITPSNQRLEMFVTDEENELGEPIRCFKVYEPEGCVQWSTVDEPKEFVPEARETVRFGGEIINFITDDVSLSINNSDFRLRRVSENGYMKIGFTDNSPPLQLDMCPDESACIVQHVLTTDENGKKLKNLCYEFGICGHRQR